MCVCVFIDKMRSRPILDNELATSNMNRLGMSTPTKICLVRGQKAKSTLSVMLEIWKHRESNPNLACRISDETAINDLAIRLGSRRRRKKEERTRKRRTRKVDWKENEGLTLYLRERDRLRFCESLSFFQSKWTAKNQKSISAEKDWKRIQIIHFKNNNKKNVPCKVKPWFRDTRASPASRGQFSISRTCVKRCLCIYQAVCDLWLVIFQAHEQSRWNMLSPVLLAQHPENEVETLEGVKLLNRQMLVRLSKFSQDIPWTKLLKVTYLWMVS